MEVRRRLISREGARRYGVTLHSDPSLDREDTKSLREHYKQSRSSETSEPSRLDVNRGESWKELKANCLQETGLPAPRAPWDVEIRGPRV